MKPKIILVNGKNPFRSKGGYQTYTLAVFKMLKSLGYQATILSLSPSFSTFPFLRNRLLAGLLIFAPFLANDLVKMADKDKGKIIVFGIGPWGFAGAIAKLFRRKKIFLLTFYPTTFRHEFRGTLAAVSTGDYGLLAKLRANVIYVTIIYSYSLLERFLLWRSDKVLVHYESARQILMKEFGLSSSKIIKTSDTIDGQRVLSKKTVVSGQSRIVAICRQDGRKGINFLLRALRILKDRGIRYSAVIAGGGEFLHANRRLGQELGLRDVSFPGTIENSDSLLRSAGIYVLPSLEEGSSAYGLFEAMRMGIPIVASRVDGIVEDIEDGKSGLLVKRGDSTALADAIEKLIKNPRLARRLGLGAMAGYQKKHNFNQAKDELSKVLRDLSVFTNNT